MGSTRNFNPPASSVAAHATVYCPGMWAGDPRIGENSDPERGREQVKCVSARTEEAFHEAFDRRLAPERTRHRAVEESTAAGSAGHAPEWRCTMPTPEIEG